ncbi:MAG: DUF177 domain-containing protein [Actinomycetota bacterium]|jgi:uncharacterized protein|nr:DUF177 domain-containing protein [Actinomycetota bacterium]MDA8293606.1 DUF177 domain-containing protein [Actinomycetota bacterium]
MAPDRSRPYVVGVAALRRVAGSSRQVELRAPVADVAVLSASVPDDAEVDVLVELSSYPGGIMVTGTVSAPWRGECRRCGGTVEGRLSSEVRERFEPSATSGGAGGDDDAYELEGTDVDLEPLVRDALLLELPLAPLCTEGCRGLCSRCGADLNVTSCDCAAEVDVRWSVLDQLRGPEGE